MKGLVFTEFMDLVENKFGLEVLDEIITESKLESDGIYTSIGTYPFSEMVELLTNLSKKVNIPPNDLLYVFGRSMFSSLANSMPDVIRGYSGPIEFFESIHDHIHVHVRKIYPDAELPSFKVLNKTETSIVMIYESSRALYCLGHGLMDESLKHFNHTANVEYYLMNDDGTKVRFEVTNIRKS